jgi:N-methylhydantoinase B
MDPVLTAVMHNRFTAIVEEASAALYRTAHTTFVKLVQDFQCALATRDGEVFAYPSRSGVNSFIGIPIQGLLDNIDIDTLRPGDCFITNDPFSTDGMVTHIMDMTIVRPIFYADEVIAFSWAYVHVSDIGGSVPGSISPTSTEVFQEGIRIRPVKLYQGGELNTDIVGIMMDNSRIPSAMWGDFQAMLSAMKTMERRLVTICDRYGVDAVRTAMADVLDLGEAKARAVIESIPDGTYTFSDYIEGTAEGDYTLIRVSLTIDGDDATIDFSGTDPQVAAAYNFVTGPRTHPYAILALLYYILTIDPEAPRNAGLLRPVRTIAPRGTVVNAEFPAAGGSRVASSSRVYDCILGCLDQAIPNGVVAAGPGASGIIVVGSADPAGRGRRVDVINPICGGGGGRSVSDGTDAIDGRSGYLRSVPTEVVETETVIRVRRFGLIPDSQAPGKFHGGAAVVLELENTGLDTTVTVRGQDRFHLEPWGVRGGRPGQVGQVTVNPDTRAEQSIGKVTVLKLGRGDVLRFVTSSGGGLGDPYERDLGLIEADLVRGLLTPRKAAEGYGVRFSDDGAIDPAATRRARDELRRTRSGEMIFALGERRESYEAQWPADVRAELARTVLSLPSSIRHHVMGAVRARLSALHRPIGSADVTRAVEEERTAVG